MTRHCDFGVSGPLPDWTGACGATAQAAVSPTPPHCSSRLEAAELSSVTGPLPAVSHPKSQTSQSRKMEVVTASRPGPSSLNEGSRW